MRLALRYRLALVLLLSACPGCRSERGGPLELYVSDSAVVRAEFLRFAGRPLDSNAANRLQNAHSLAARRDYRGAVAILLAESANANAPFIHSNLGVLYAALGDVLNAQDHFQGALRLDSGYGRAHEGLDRLTAQGLIADMPVTHEVEPNDSVARANNISIDVPVTGEVRDQGDMDTFRFKAPDGPRDLVRVSVGNSSKSLAPYLRIHDGDQRFVLWNKDAKGPGSTIEQFFSPQRGGIYYLEIWGQNRSAGAYTLTVHPMKAFDAYEPNDDIMHAAAISVPGRSEAGVMDANDSDFYRVTAAASTLSISIENRSSTLVPSVTVYGADRTLIGFGPETAKPGTGLTHSVSTVTGQTYYVQVWGRLQSSGAYTLALK